jgi:predicted RNA-binding protein with PIN domain
VSAAVEAEAEAVAGVVADLEFRLATASEQAAQLTTERDLAEAAARDAVARRQRAETDLAVARTDLGRLRKELQAASGDAAALRTTIEQLGAELDAARNRSAGLDAALTAAEDELAELRARTAAGVDRALAEQVDAVAAQARELARALEVAAAALDPTEPVTAPARSPEPRRRPAELPPGLHDDSLEVAAHLLRVPGMVVLIDGYNLSHVRWADLDPAEQRARLVAALEALAARTGADLEVVFDGADVGLPAAAHQRRSHVRVRFSPAGVEADDVVIDAVDRVSSRRPVTVVSSDRRVRDGARARGARVVGSERFAELLTH